jgi:carbamate kinase
VTDDVDAAVARADFLYTDVWVSMGEPEAEWGERIPLLLPNRVDAEMLQKTGNRELQFLHCLPSVHDRHTELGQKAVERFQLDGVEVSDDVFRSPSSRVYDQAENRMHTITAVLLASLRLERRIVVRLVIALGGNALLRNGERPEAETQTDRLTSIAPALASLADNNEVVLVHGNGPQVGLFALENITDTTITTPYPLSDMVAESQGLIGAWIQRSLLNAQATKPMVTVISQTIVDQDDPGWSTPSKYVGPEYTTTESSVLAKRHGWNFREEHAGFRRVVACPMPREVVERSTISELLDAGITVVAGGGGGIPLTRIDGHLLAVDAVVDKDAVASLLAINLHADLLVILTDAPGLSPASEPRGRS